MKKLISVGFFACSIVAFAASEQPRYSSPVLWPAEHSICVNAELNIDTANCPLGSELYMDQNGRCGCLRTEEIMPMDFCERAEIFCNEDEGESYSMLYQYKNMCGMFMKLDFGCGCYGTAGDMPVSPVR